MLNSVSLIKVNTEFEMILIHIFNWLISSQTLLKVSYEVNQNKKQKSKFVFTY